MEQSLGLLNVMAVEEGEEPALYRSELDHTREGKCRGETGPRYTACAAHQAATYQKVGGPQLSEATQHRAGEPHFCGI